MRDRHMGDRRRDDRMGGGGGYGRRDAPDRRYVSRSRTPPRDRRAVDRSPHYNDRREQYSPRDRRD